MNKIMELRNKRNTLWEQTKAFLEDHRGENGLVCSQRVLRLLRSSIILFMKYSFSGELLRSFFDGNRHKKSRGSSFQPLQLVFQDFIRHCAVLGFSVHADHLCASWLRSRCRRRSSRPFWMSCSIWALV